MQSSGVLVDTEVYFTIETFHAGQGHVEAFLKSPSGEKTPVSIRYSILFSSN